MQRHFQRRSHRDVTRRLDGIDPGMVPDDTVPTNFPSIDRMLGGGFRARDLVVLGGDVGSGKSSLALAVAIRAAAAGHEVLFLSGEMDEDRLVERALAMESRLTIEQLRSGKLDDGDRARVGATALRLDELPLAVRPMAGRTFDEVFENALTPNPALVVVDYLQLLPAPSPQLTQNEEAAAALRALKSLAMAERIACLGVSQLVDFNPTRDDPRPRLEDYGALGSVKQHADVVLSIFREEMYGPRIGIAGATELHVAKNRNGPTGFVDLYFYRQWLRFEDMLDPEETRRPRS